MPGSIGLSLGRVGSVSSTSDSIEEQPFGVSPMSFAPIHCARCTFENHAASRFCESCGLPLGTAEPDAEAAQEALGPYEVPDPADPDTSRVIREFALRSGYDVQPAGHGYRLVVPMPSDRQQAVYVGYVGADRDGRPMIALVSVCGPANHRDSPSLLKLNAVTVEGHFAIKVLRGEEYYVVIRNLTPEMAYETDAQSVVERIAELADGLEDRLTRGRDLF